MSLLSRLCEDSLSLSSVTWNSNATTHDMSVLVFAIQVSFAGIDLNSAKETFFGTSESAPMYDVYEIKFSVLSPVTCNPVNENGGFISGFESKRCFVSMSDSVMNARLMS